LLFAEDASFQESRTCRPLKLTLYHYAPNEPEEFKEEILYDVPVRESWGQEYPSRHQIIRDDMLISMSDRKNNQNTVIVNINRDSTDDNISYVFKWDGCWYLAEKFSYPL
jgi:hypothetical protein